MSEYIVCRAARIAYRSVLYGDPQSICISSSCSCSFTAASSHPVFLASCFLESSLQHLPLLAFGCMYRAFISFCHQGGVESCRGGGAYKQPVSSWSFLRLSTNLSGPSSQCRCAYRGCIWPIPKTKPRICNHRCYLY